MAYVLTPEDEKILRDVQRSFVIETHMVDLVYRTPAMVLRQAADRLDYEQGLAARFEALLQRVAQANNEATA